MCMRSLCNALKVSSFISVGPSRNRYVDWHNVKCSVIKQLLILLFPFCRNAHELLKGLAHASSNIFNAHASLEPLLQVANSKTVVSRDSCASSDEVDVHDISTTSCDCHDLKSVVQVWS